MVFHFNIYNIINIYIMDFKIFIAILVILLSIMYTQPNLLYNIVDNCLGKAVFLTIVLYLALHDIKLGFIAGILLIVAIQTRSRIENFVEGNTNAVTLDTISDKLSKLAKDDSPKEDLLLAFAKALAYKEQWKDVEPGTQREPSGTQFIFFGTDSLPTLKQIKNTLNDEEYKLFYDKYKTTPLKWADIDMELNNTSKTTDHTHEVKHVISEKIPVKREGFSISSNDLLSNNEKIRSKDSNMYNVKRPGNV